MVFALLAGLAFLVYWPALSGALIYDDFHHVTRLELRSWAGLARIWTDPWATAQYYPAAHSFFWLQHRIWGNAVVGYHAVNILLHAGAALLLAAVARKLGLAKANWVALAFLLHPVAVESVAWISEQKNTLSTVFYLGATLAYLHFNDNRSWRSYTQASVLFGLALLSKSVTATLPAALLVIFWWRAGQLKWRRDIVPLVPWLFVGVLAGLHTAWLEKHSIGAQGPTFSLGAIERVLLAGRAFWFYLGKGFVPTELVFNYPRWTIDAAQMWQYSFPAGALALVGAGIWLARKRRGPLAWLLLFGGPLFPVLGFFNVYPFRFSYVADHFMYLALLPLAVALVVIVEALMQNDSKIIRNGTLLAAAVGLIWFGIGARQHSCAFKTEEVFYREILARNPRSTLAHYNLGTLLATQPGGKQTAIAEYRAAIDIDPTYAEAYNNLGMLLQEQPDGKEAAVKAFTAALAAMPDLVEANYNLAMILKTEGARIDEARQLLKKAIHLRPRLAEAHYQLGCLAESEGKTPEAVAAYQRAVELRPDYVAARYALGLVLSADPSRLMAAEMQLAEVVHLAPKFAEAYYSLGVVRARQPGKQDEAMAAYREALRLAPDFAEAHNNLGRLLAKNPNRLPEAIAHFEAALRINPDSPEARRNLETARKAIARQR